MVVVGGPVVIVVGAVFLLDAALVAVTLGRADRRGDSGSTEHGPGEHQGEDRGPPAVLDLWFWIRGTGHRRRLLEWVRRQGYGPPSSEPRRASVAGVSRYLEPPRPDVLDVVSRALAEDLTPLGDLSATLLPPGAAASAAFVARRAGVIAGSACVRETFRQVDDSLRLDWAVSDGDEVAAGTELGAVHGSLESILVAERTALNFLMYLSGIATNTAEFMRACSGGAGVWDTRKTTPGLRSLEKAAVRAGGGRNHRGNLSDWIMLKDNHLRGLSIAEGVARARDRWPGRTIHVEADRLDQVEEAVRAGADAILLDNMDPDGLRAAVARVDELSGSGRRPLVEASGGIDLDTIGAVAATGVDMISTSKLNFGAPTLDIGLDVTAAAAPGSS